MAQWITGKIAFRGPQFGSSNPCSPRESQEEAGSNGPSYYDQEVAEVSGRRHHAILAGTSNICILKSQGCWQ